MLVEKQSEIPIRAYTVLRTPELARTLKCSVDSVISRIPSEYLGFYLHTVITYLAFYRVTQFAGSTTTGDLIC